MEAHELLRAFEAQTTLPVDVNDVLTKLREAGHADNVEFVGVDLDPSVLQGAIKIWHQRAGVYGDPERMVNIYYHRGADPAWQRMICCKELLHLIDSNHTRTTTLEDVRQLADEIGLPPELQNPFQDGAATNVDRVAEFRAAAILLPFAAREILLPAYEAGKLSLEDIARQADMPRKYAGLVMHSSWEMIYKIMTMRQPDDGIELEAAE